MSDVQFQNRSEAAKKLAVLLKKYKVGSAVVLGIPRGGAITAKVIAKELSLPFGLIIVRKIGHPQIPEYAIAAISESGTLVENKEETQNIDPVWLKEETERQLSEALRRRNTYWGKQNSLNLKGKTVIIIDDGLATGLTMAAAVQEVRNQKPKKIVVAVPVCPADTAEKLKKIADEFVALDTPEIFEGAVGAYYKEFPQVGDEEIVAITTIKKQGVIR